MNFLLIVLIVSYLLFKRFIPIFVCCLGGRGAEGERADQGVGGGNERVIPDPSHPPPPSDNDAVLVSER